MFLSRAEVVAKNTQSWSIATRLSLLYTVLAFMVLVLISGYLYVTLGNYLKRKDSLAVRDQVVQLRHMLSEVNKLSVPLSKARQWEERGVDNKRFQSRILDDKYGVLAESPHMVPEPKVFPMPAEAAELLMKGADWTAPDGRKYALMSAWGSSGRAPEKRKIIQVAFERASSMELLEDFGETLLVTLAIGSLLIAIIANLSARRAMKPLHDIAAAARRISASQLHERIESARWPKELKDLGAAFDDMLQRLEDSFIRLSQFSSDLAHELRTPINNLVGETEVALSRARSAEEYHDVLESSLEEYQRLSRMIDSLLFLARADAPAMHIEPVELDVQTELDGICEFYEALADGRGVHLSCDAEVRLISDPILFRRAVSNLISNALRYTPSGGSVTITAQSARDGFIDVAVRDTGTGILSHHLPRIFDRFYRADVARSNYSEGAGLGLAIVKSIMNLHKGLVSAASIPGQGTTITLRFLIPPRPKGALGPVS